MQLYGSHRKGMSFGKKKVQKSIYLRKEILSYISNILILLLTAFNKDFEFDKDE